VEANRTRGQGSRRAVAPSNDDDDDDDDESTVVISYGYSLRQSGLRPNTCCDCRFEGLSLVTVVCFPAEVSVKGRSLVQGSPTDCDVSLYVI
jgi:hypothetical protein